MTVDPGIVLHQDTDLSIGLQRVGRMTEGDRPHILSNRGQILYHPTILGLGIQHHRKIKEATILARGVLKSEGYHHFQRGWQMVRDIKGGYSLLHILTEAEARILNRAKGKDNL